MKKYKFIESIASPTWSYRVGQVVEEKNIPSDILAIIKGGGLAVEIATAEPEVETTARKSRRKKVNGN